MKQQIKARLTWVNLYLETKDAGYVCRKCGISRPTLRKWYKRYLEAGIDGLNDQRKKPHLSPRKKLSLELIKLILDLRINRNLGARRIQTELIRLHNCSLFLASIHKALTSNQTPPIKKLKRKKKFKRYSRRTATNTLHFLDLVLEQFPFPIQRIQTDRGLEFFAEKVQLKMMELGIKFRPNKPASPHLNGKVERSQKTDLEEFYAITNLSNFETLREELAQWQFFYNWQRPHGSLKGKPPSAIVAELSEITPFSEEVSNNYKIDNERIQIANYHKDLIMKKLKGSL